MPFGVPRVATEDTELPNGCPIRQGTAVIVIYGAADVDESQCPVPFDALFDRDSNRHIAFGVLHNRRTMATFVLVHGAMHGGWCWRDVRSSTRSPWPRSLHADTHRNGGPPSLLDPGRVRRDPRRRSRRPSLLRGPPARPSGPPQLCRDTGWSSARPLHRSRHLRHPPGCVHRRQWPVTARRRASGGQESISRPGGQVGCWLADPCRGLVSFPMGTTRSPSAIRRSTAHRLSFAMRHRRSQIRQHLLEAHSFRVCPPYGPTPRQLGSLISEGSSARLEDIRHRVRSRHDASRSDWDGRSLDGGCWPMIGCA